MEPTARGAVLSFEHTDLPRMRRNIEEVAKAFEKAGCSADVIYLGCPDFQQKFRQFLDGSEPRIIFVSSHGGPKRANSGELFLCSHGLRTTNYREIDWAVIQGIIDAAKCDVLVIVDCCYAGLAQVNSGDDTYAKELIAATSWDAYSYGRLAPSLVSALASWHENSESRSSSSLYIALTAAIEDMRLWAGDPVIRELEEKRYKAEIDMNRLLLEKNRLLLDMTQDSGKLALASVEKEIQTLAKSVKSFKEQIAAAKQVRKQAGTMNPQCYKQPIFRPARSKVNRHWAARQYQRGYTGFEGFGM
ncbi:hypothetical protein TWF696_009283 [Orbilia brochopaga]|uniref:Uncharacterized protein n=1 Tax=Orbilia brochopaga TaxID=3140254 RepID=A0AAV9UES0_9PEZI